MPSPTSTTAPSSVFEALSRDPSEAERQRDPGVPARSLDHLDWFQLCSLISDECRLQESTRIAANLPLLKRRPEIAFRITQIEELCALMREGERLPRLRLDSILEPVVHARRGALLEPRQLRQIAQTVEAFSSIRGFFSEHREALPSSWPQAEPLPALRDLRHAIESSFSPRGEILDSASPDLGRLRRRLTQLHEQMRSSIERKVKRTQMDGDLQDDYFTIRKGRYVLPVKLEAKGRVDGIVHDRSSSGQTVFVEPTELIELNNQLHMAAFEVKAEERRILKRFSELVERHHEALEDGYQRLIFFDVTIACANFCDSISASVPVLSERRRIHLEHARHPVLERRLREEDREIVSNTIALEPEHDVLVISGSNAGGKTVTLKTLGLFALMIRAGLPIPCELGSEMPIYWRIFTDIGDNQSIQNDTSTFSGHVLNMRSFIEDIDEDALVLLDEPFAGTDPPHVASLGMALLELINERHAKGVITTHLDRLKAFAVETDWLRNASVGFSVPLLSPTYELQLDFPGSSNALEIATKLGLPKRLLARATELLGTSVGIESILRDLGDEHELVRRRREELDAKLSELEAEKRRMRKAIEEARSRDRNAIDKANRRFINEANRLRNQLARQVKRLQNPETHLDHDEIEAIRGAIEAAEEKVESEADAVAPPDAVEVERDRVETSKLSPGQLVFSSSYKKKGTLLEVDGDTATIQIGVFKVDVPVSDLFEEEQPQPRRTRSRKGRSKRERRDEHIGRPRDDEPIIVRSSDNTLDLRGCRVDEAEERVELYIDSALRRDLPGLFIIHGHGTGALKKAVRKQLSRSRYIRAFRAGTRHEGGDGVTIATLA